MKKVEKQET